MAIKLVVSDVDGTLIGRSGFPTVKTSDTLRRIRAAGVTVALATARRWSGCYTAASALDMCGPLILYDGALMRSFPDGEVLALEEMDREHVAEACDALASAGLRPIVQYFHEDGERNITLDWSDPDASAPFLELYAREVGIVTGRELHSQSGYALRVVAFGAHEKLKELQQRLSIPALSSQLLLSGGYGADELTMFREGVSKGAQVLKLAKILGVELQETLAIGDGENDVSMFQVAGVSVVMGQARPTVKLAARAETATCEEDGAALALERYVLSGVEIPATKMEPRITDDPDELLDVVDVDDNVVGTVRRADAHWSPTLIHRSVEVIVLTSRGTVILQRRSMSKDLYPGMLCASASGHVSAGQGYDEAARREMLEELGIEAEIEPIGTCLVRAARETELTAVYLARHDGPFAFSPVETDGGLGIPLSELLDPQAPARPDFVPGLVEGLALLETYVRAKRYTL